LSLSSGVGLASNAIASSVGSFPVVYFSIINWRLGMRLAKRLSTSRQFGSPEYATARTMSQWSSALIGNIFSMSSPASCG